MEVEVVGEKSFGIEEMWSNDPILVMHFAFRSHFQKFYTDVSRIMVKYQNRVPFNSVTSFVRFYEEFKKQDNDLLTFYETVHKPTITEDSQNCVGKAIYLKRKLLKHAGNEYRNIENYLYIASCNHSLSDNIPSRYHNGFPQNLGQYVHHCGLVLKFTLESERRRGFFILDPGFFIDFPVCVMEDGEAPNTGRFPMISKKGEKYCHFKYFNENYVYFLNEKYDVTKSEQSSPEHRWFFVGKKLQNVVQIEKRNLLNDFQALAFADLGGAVVFLFTTLNDRDYIEFTVQDGEANWNIKSKFLTYKIPFAYFLPEGGPRVEEWEKALKIFEEKFRPFDNIYKLLERFAVLATDLPYVKELCRINQSFRAIVEPSFNY